MFKIFNLTILLIIYLTPLFSKPINSFSFKSYKVKIAILSDSTKIKRFKKGENFQYFKQKFFSDSSFQISRVSFPVQQYQIDRKKFWSILLGENADTLKMLPKSKWHFHSSLASDTSNYEVKTKYLPGKVIYVERGKDFGIATIYKFIIIDNKWFLTRVEYVNL